MSKLSQNYSQNLSKSILSFNFTKLCQNYHYRRQTTSKVSTVYVCTYFNVTIMMSNTQTQPIPPPSRNKINDQLETLC